MKPNETIQREDVIEILDDDSYEGGVRYGNGRLALRKGKDNKVLVEQYNGFGVLSSSITIGLRELIKAVGNLGGKG